MPPKKISCQIFLPKKILASKISNPKEAFDNLCHLKSGVPPWGYLIVSLLISYDTNIYTCVILKVATESFLGFCYICNNIEENNPAVISFCICCITMLKDAGTIHCSDNHHRGKNVTEVIQCCKTVTVHNMSAIS